MLPHTTLGIASCIGEASATCEAWAVSAELGSLTIGSADARTCNALSGTEPTTGANCSIRVFADTTGLMVAVASAPKANPTTCRFAEAPCATASGFATKPKGLAEHSTA